MAGGLFLVCTGAVVTMVGLATLPVSGPIATGVLGLVAGGSATTTWKWAWHNW